MPGCAVISEYNPFQRGHARQIADLRALFPDACVTSVLAGNFVQRGEPAVLSKYKRAEAAVRAGVDLVLELPFPWSAQGAPYYARAAVSVAAGAGCRALCFGSETGDLSALETAARRVTSPEFAAALSESEKEEMRSPASHIATVRAVYSGLYGEELPSGANDTLAVEYLRSIIALGLDLSPVCFRRYGGYTATAARELYRAGDLDGLAEVVPEELVPFYRENAPLDPSLFGDTALTLLKFTPPEEISGCADLGGGIAERLCRAARTADDYETFRTAAATKKYTDSRLRRAVLAAITRTTEADVTAPPLYTVLLAANERGLEFLAQNRKNAALPVLTRSSDAARLSPGAKEQLALSRRADALYAHAAGTPAEPADFCRPFILR